MHKRQLVSGIRMVFAGARFATSAGSERRWERQKADEKAARGQGALDDVPLTLPALKRAEKLGKRRGGRWIRLA